MDFDDVPEEVLSLLDDGGAMDLDWILEDPPAVAPPRPSSTSPPRARPRLEACAFGGVEGLPNLSSVSRSLATPAPELTDLSAVSRSFAGDESAPAATVRRRKVRGRQPAAMDCDEEPLGNMSAVSHSLAHLGMVRQCNQATPRAPPAPAGPPRAPPKPAPLSNASAVSRNLAHVGAVPQCNQQATRSAPGVAPRVPVADEVEHEIVAEAVPLAVAERRLRSDDSAEGRAAFDAAAAAIDATLRAPAEAPAAPPPPPRPARRARVVEADPAKMGKLEIRRAKNREAAERMRRRRREEHDTLTAQVKDLTDEVASLKLALQKSDDDKAAMAAELRLLRGAAAAPSKPESLVPAGACQVATPLP